MPDSSSSEDENGGYDSQSSRRGQFSPAFENTENGDAQSFHEDFHFRPIKKSVSLSDTQSSESVCASDKKSELSDAQSFESDCSSDKKSELSDMQSSEKDCPSNKNSELSDAQSSEIDCPSNKNSELSDAQSFESDCSSDKKSELSDMQSSEKDCPSNKNSELSDTQSSKSDCSDKKSQLSDAQSSEKDHPSNKISELPDTQSSESDCFLDKNSDILSSENDCSSDKEHEYSYSESSESSTSFPNEKYVLTRNQPSEKNCSSLNKIQELIETQASENYFSFPDKKHKLTNAQLSENASHSPDEKQLLSYDHQLFNDDCPFSDGEDELNNDRLLKIIYFDFFSDSESLKSDSSTLDKKHELINVQSPKSDCLGSPIDTQLHGNDFSFLKERLELTEAQSSRSFCPDYPVDMQSLESNLITYPSERCTLANTQALEYCNSSTLSEKHNLTNTELSGNVGSLPSDELDENYTHSAENDSSSLKRKNTSPFHESVFSSLSKKRNLSNPQSPKDDCSSIPENCVKTHLPEIDISSPNESYYFPETLLPQFNRSPSHRKHKLTVTDYSDSDCSSVPGVKRKLLCKELLESGRTSGSDWFPFPERHENDELLNSILLNKNSDGIKALLNNECEKVLRIIIRTAYQFTRHSCREKLTLEDLEKSFKIHKIDMANYSDGSVDLIDRESVEEDESLSITCTGKWIRRPENMSKKV